jgi:hypothetical protein
MIPLFNVVSVLLTLKCLLCGGCSSTSYKDCPMIKPLLYIEFDGLEDRAQSFFRVHGSKSL